MLSGGLEAARAIGIEEVRARMLAALLPRAPDPEAVLRVVRQTMADHLLKNLSATERGDVLQFCAAKELFAPPILEQETLAAIARHIAEVCQDWRWM